MTALGPEAKEEAAGSVIAERYEVVRVLGRGGMGKVLLVKDRETGQDLAMKLIRTQYEHNDRAMKRFAREVLAVRQLNHPCIVKIFDARRDGNRLYYTMEYIKGKSVRDWLKQRGQLNLGSVVRVLCLVANGLEHAHKVTIHRDISPDNIMVTGDGSVRILDFGLAKLNDAAQGFTIVGANLGKIQYNAPEQRRNAADVDLRADIYPLGIMFFEMLTGHRPKVKETIAENRPDLPRECDAFYQKAAAEDRDERFANAKEFSDALLALYESSKQAPEPARGFGARLRGILATLNPFRLLRRSRAAEATKP